MPSTTGGLRAKEAERVDTPSWPEPSNYRSWKLSVVESVVLASFFSDHAFRWMLEVQAEGATLETLVSSKFGAKYGTHFDSGALDAKLGSTLTKAAPTVFLNTTQARKHDDMREGTRLHGRQIMFLIDKHFKIIEAGGAVYDIEHFLSVTMNNDIL